MPTASRHFLPLIALAGLSTGLMFHLLGRAGAAAASARP
jgi:hypothetical protein